MIDTALQQNILSLVEENNSLFLKAKNIEAFLEKEDCTAEIDNYRNHSILQLLWKDFSPFIVVMIFLGIIYAVLAIDLLIFVIFGVIFAIPLIFSAFACLVFLLGWLKLKRIILYCISIFVLYQMDSPEWLIFIATILFVLFCRFQELSKRQKQIRYLDEIEQRIRINNNKIIHLATSSIIAFVHQERMADVNSIHAHGFSCLPEAYIHDILNQHLSKENIERISLQNNTILYKSNKNNPDDEHMTTTYLEID